jgi:hypothetical protein
MIWSPLSPIHILLELNNLYYPQLIPQHSNPKNTMNPSPFLHDPKDLIDPEDQAKPWPLPTLDEANRWVKALESGQYVQIKQRLASLHSIGKVGHCCLGVACMLFIPAGKRVTRVVEGLIMLDYNMPVSQLHAPAWLRHINDWFRKVDGISLADMNDKNNNSFKEIAEQIKTKLIPHLKP